MSDNKNQHQENNIDEEIVYDETESQSDLVKKVKNQLKECKQEKQEYLDGWQRSKADFVNFKKRSEEEKKDFVKYATENIISDIIPTLDSFDMAFKDTEAWEKVSENWRKGIEYIYNQLINTLENHGVKQINPIGENFDPTIHDSIESIESDEEEGKILEVSRKGYSLNGKIIRVPQVKICKKHRTLL